MPKQKDAPAHVKKARVGLITQTAQTAAELRLNARQIALLAVDDEHPATEALAEEAAVAAEGQEAVVAAFKGEDVAGILSSIRGLRRSTLRQRLTDFKQLREQHEAFVDDPAAFGFTDLGGRPLDEAEQRRYVQEYAAAITAIEEELAELD